MLLKLLKLYLGRKLQMVADCMCNELMEQQERKELTHNLKHMRVVVVDVDRHRIGGGGCKLLLLMEKRMRSLHGRKGI